MVKNDQDFVDPLEYLTETELDELEAYSKYAKEEEQKGNVEMLKYDKVSKILEKLLSMVDNDVLIIIIFKMVKQLDEIEFADYDAITKKIDDIYWESQYDWETGYDETNDNDKIANFFNKKDAKEFALFHRDKQRAKVYNKSKSSWYSKKVLPDFIDLNEKQIPANVKFSMSSLATAKLFVMMKYYQNVEWGAYMKLDKALPKLDDLYINGDLEIKILDLILIPQVRSSASVEYLENELPEFMEEWRQAKIDKFYVNSGRIHSHHTMGSWHSVTDNGEFEKSFETEDRLLSIIVSFDDKLNKIDQSKDLLDWDYFFKALEYESVLFIPLVGDQKNTIDCDYGYTIKRSIWLNKYGINEIQKAIEWRDQFEKMDIFVHKKYPLIKNLLELQKAKKINEVDFFNIRSQIYENKNMFSFVEDLINLLVERNTKAISNTIYKSRLEEIKKITDR